MTHRMPEPFTTPEDDALLQFEGTSPYEDYVHASVLSSLQQPLTDAPEEMAFLVTTQVMELWFTLIVHEWRTARDALLKDDYDAAMDALRRSLSSHRALNESWAPIAKLTPLQFNGFRAAFGQASGFQSAMYRHMEFLLGDKSEAMTRPHRGHPVVYTELCESLAQPSLYDEVLGYLHRQGLPVPEHLLERPRPRGTNPTLKSKRPGGGSMPVPGTTRWWLWVRRSPTSPNWSSVGAPTTCWWCAGRWAPRLAAAARQGCSGLSSAPHAPSSPNSGAHAAKSRNKKGISDSGH